MTKTARARRGRPPGDHGERNARIHALRKQGLTYERIGELVGMTATGVWQIATGYDGYAKRKKKRGND